MIERCVVTKTKLDLTLFDDQIKAVEALVLPGAVSRFERDDEVIPTSFVFATHGKDTERAGNVVVLVASHAGEDKDEMRATQGHLVDRFGAVGIALLCEAWVVWSEPSDGTFFDCSVSPSEHPDRHEVLMVTLWHRDGIYTWQAPILRSSDQPPRLGDFVKRRTETDALHGRFTNYFRNQRTVAEA